MKPAILNISKLTKLFGKERVLDQVSLTVDHGDVFCLLGPNGSGKTTMISCVLSLLTSDAGEVALFDVPHSLSANKRIGVVLEDDGFFRDMSVEKNLEIVCLLKGVSYDLIPDILERLSLLEHRRKRVKKLSQGMRKRLSIACSLIDDPELLIWDEPYNSLDPSGFQLVRQLLSEMKSKGKTIIVSTHLLDEVKKAGTKVGLIYEGVMKEVLCSSEIEQKYGTLEQFYFHHVTAQIRK